MGRAKHALAATIRARINRYRGHAFELSLRRRLTNSGFTVTRVNEADGYTHGVDLLVARGATSGSEPGQQPGQPSCTGTLVPVQVKRTEEWTDLFVALREVRLACPSDPLCIAIHGWAPRGHRIPRITCAVSRLPALPLTMQVMKLPELIALLKTYLSSEKGLDSPVSPP